MHRSDIPFSALRSFEVAGRHLNYGKAATELNVSRAAISHQIGLLEAQIGINLFERVRSGVELTNAGARLLESLTRSFNDISDSLDHLRNDAEVEELKIAISEELFTGFFKNLLVELGEILPEINLQITCITSGSKIDVSEYDFVSIWRGSGDKDNESAVPLLKRTLTPLCSPALAKDINGTNDISKLRLLHAESENDWDRWLELAGERPRLFSKLRSDSPSFLASISSCGLGVALLSPILFKDWIEAGKLIQLFPLEIDSGYYMLIRGKHQASTMAMRKFEEWLMEASLRF